MAMTTFTWKSSISGEWVTASDWMPAGGPPDISTDSAVIDAAGSYTVTVGGEIFSVDQVSLDAATATLQIDGSLGFSGSATHLLALRARA
jgi:hypothetical protein